MPRTSIRPPLLGVVLVGVALGMSALGASIPAPVGGLENLYPWPEDPTNLIQNGSFEQMDGSGEPLGWNVTESGYLFPDGSAKHSGSFSLHLKDSHLAPFTPGAIQAPVSLTPGWYTLSGWGKAVNAGSNTTGAGGRIAVRTQSSGWPSTSVIRGTRDWTRVSRSFAVNAAEPNASVRLEAYRKPNGHVFFDDVAIRRQVSPLIEGFLLYPNYRGVLFEDASQEIRVGVKLHPGEAGLTLADLEVLLTVEGSGGVLASRSLRPTVPAFITSIDGSGLPLGGYRLRLRALRASTGQALFEYPAYRITKLAAQDRARLGTYVDAGNRLVMAGKPRFALGIYDAHFFSEGAYDQRIAKIAEAPFNLYLNYWLGNTASQNVLDLMDTLQNYGMSYLHTTNIWYEDHYYWRDWWQCNGQTSGTLGDQGFTTCMAQTLGNHPALGGWYTADERRADEAERVFGQYKLLRANEPGGVAFIAQNLPREIERWRDTADAFDLHTYPIFNVPEGELSPLHQVYDYTVAAREAVAGSRPIWTVIQFYRHGSNGHWPTYDELRSMSYLAIVGGARGLFYWSYGGGGLEGMVKDPATRENYWQRLVDVVRELNSLETALIAPDAPEILNGVSPAESIRVVARKVGNVTYIIAVNGTAAPGIQARFTLAGGGSETLEVVSEGRTVQTSSGVFTDVFGPYEAHVYKTSGEPSLPPSPTPGPGIPFPKNGSFEDVDGSDRPRWWTLGTGAWKLDREAHAGTRSLLLSGADRQSYAPTATSAEIYVEPGVYHLTGFVKTQGLSDGAEDGTVRGIRLALRMSNNRYEATSILNGTNDWTELTRTGIQVSESGFYTVVVQAYNKPSGSAWVDEVRFIRQDHVAPAERGRKPPDRSPRRSRR